MKHTILIQWSDEDQCYVVSLPEWGEFCHTHGETYAEAFQNAQEVLELLIESALPSGAKPPQQVNLYPNRKPLEKLFKPFRND